MWSADIEWPEEDEALSDSARSTIDALLSSDPLARPDALGWNAFLNCLCIYIPSYECILFLCC